MILPCRQLRILRLRAPAGWRAAEKWNLRLAMRRIADAPLQTHQAPEATMLMFWQRFRGEGKRESFHRVAPAGLPIDSCVRSPGRGAGPALLPK